MKEQLDFNAVMGSAISQYERGDRPSVEIRRRDGHVSRIDLDQWLRWDVPGDPLLESLANEVRGPDVLDVGCGAGRYTYGLQKRGLKAVGIDSCAEAIEAGVRRGAVELHMASVWDPLPGKFDDLLLLGATIGIAGRMGRLDTLLAHLIGAVRPGGTIWLDSVDVGKDARGVHGQWNEQQLAAGRDPGEVELRLAVGQVVSDEFEWLWVSPEALQQAATRVGVECELLRVQGPKYSAALRKRGPTRLPGTAGPRARDR